MNEPYWFTKSKRAASELDDESWNTGGVSPTLNAMDNTGESRATVLGVVNSQVRRLTPRECAKLMGYPDDFQIPVSDTQAYRQFGNSVVVPVVERLAKAVVTTLLRPTYFSPEHLLTANDSSTSGGAKGIADPVIYHGNPITKGKPTAGTR